MEYLIAIIMLIKQQKNNVEIGNLFKFNTLNKLFNFELYQMEFERIEEKLNKSQLMYLK